MLVLVSYDALLVDVRVMMSGSGWMKRQRRGSVKLFFSVDMTLVPWQLGRCGLIRRREKGGGNIEKRPTMSGPESFTLRLKDCLLSRSVTSSDLDVLQCLPKSFPCPLVTLTHLKYVNVFFNLVLFFYGLVDGQVVDVTR